MPEGTEILILEFGTNHFGEIKEMVYSFLHTWQLIPRSLPHLEGFKDIEGVLSAKMEICGSENLEMIIYNSDNQLLKKNCLIIIITL